jgi:hypothetical protein
MNIDKKTLHYAKKRLEYKKNPVKFIQECVKIPTPGGSQLMKLYPPQKDVVKSFFKNHYLITLKSRQIGISTIFQAISTYICTFYENIVIGIVSRDNPEASDFCRKIQNMIDELPDWLRPTYMNKSIQYFILSNGCQVWTSTVSPQNPDKTLRGKSITLLIIDEAAFIHRIEQAWTGMSQNVSKTHQDAAQSRIPFGTAIISTPNKTEGIGKWFFEMWTGANMDNNFTPHSIHWKQIPSFANDPNWYNKQCKLLNNNTAKIAQELDLKFVGSDDSLFDEDVQLQLQNVPEEPMKKISIPNSKLKIWQFQKIKRENFHIIGVDSATAAGLDNSAIEVIEYQTMNQVLEFCGKVSPKDFSEIVKLTSIHCPHNIILIENTGGYGLSVLEDLLEDEDIEFNLFGEYKENKNKTVFIPGLNTNVKTRPLILDALYDTITHDPQVIKSPRLSSELLGLINKKNRIEADKGFHDDLALAYGFCCYARKYCKDIIGNVSSLSNDAVANNQLVSKSEMIESIMCMNETSPLIPKRLLSKEANVKKRGKEDIEWTNQVNKYINDKFYKGEMKGNVNIFSIWEKDNNTSISSNNFSNWEF